MSELSEGIEFDSEDYKDEYDFDDEDEEYDFLEEELGKSCSRPSDCPSNRKCVRGVCKRHGFEEDILEEELGKSCSRPSDCPSNKKCVRGECKRHGYDFYDEVKNTISSKKKKVVLVARL